MHKYDPIQSLDKALERAIILETLYQTKGQVNMSNLMALSESTFEAEVLQETALPVLVDFWADWCAPCNALGPVIEEIAQDYQGRMKVAQVNVEQHNTLATRYGVTGIPTLILFKKGEEIARTSGYKPKNKLVNDFLNIHLEETAAQ